MRRLVSDDSSPEHEVAIDRANCSGNSKAVSIARVMVTNANAYGTCCLGRMSSSVVVQTAVLYIFVAIIHF